MQVLETDRLILRWLTPDDADFILQLVNEPLWRQHIGDRGIRTPVASRNYLEKGPLEMYRLHGFGLYCVELKGRGTPVGICGLIKRDALEDVDLGFALLAEHHTRGYAYEAASATMHYAWKILGLTRVVAITSPGNAASARLLGKLGFRFERSLQMVADAPEVNLYASDHPQAA